MTAESLVQVAIFMPHLKEVYLDDVFNDSLINEIFDKAKYVGQVAVGQSDNKNSLLTAWTEISNNIKRCPMADLKLQFLSVPGCAIDDEIMEKLAPALANIREVHLGRNPITFEGWSTLRKALMASIDSSPSTMSILNLSTSNCDQNNRKYVQPSAMNQLAYVILMMEHVDLSGQQDITKDGWETFNEIVKEEIQKGSGQIRLKSLELKSCKIDRATGELLKATFDKLHHDVIPKLEFGECSFDEPDVKITSIFSMCCPKSKCCPNSL